MWRILLSPPKCLHKRSFSSETIKFSEEVAQAKLDKKPLVALESTIIAHGMPYPQNLETARDVERIVREQGAVPATIAILKGQLTVGLTDDQLEIFAKSRQTIKTSRRDMAFVTSQGLDGATTVSGTIVAATMAGIKVFVTGGLGGVHRNGEKTLDISADLTELGRSPICVVSSGVKSILDIGRTLEYLETQGVCVATYGPTKDFPAFYTRTSGFKSPYNVNSSSEAAMLVMTSFNNLKLNSGIVIAVPVPEENAQDESEIEKAIQKALSDGDSSGISGKEVTPFVLAAVAKATGGSSLKTNIALIKNNVKIGAQISRELNKLECETNEIESRPNKSLY